MISMDELREGWAALDRRLAALDAKLDELGVGDGHGGATPSAVGECVVEVRAEAKRLEREVFPVVARAADSAALAVVIKAVPWRDDEDAHVFAGNVAAALSSFILTGATAFMAKTEPDPWLPLHADAIAPSRNMCACGRALTVHNVQRQLWSKRQGQDVCLCPGFRHVEQEGPGLGRQGMLEVLVEFDVTHMAGVAMAALQAIKSLYRIHGHWPSEWAVTEFMGPEATVEEVRQLLQALVDAQAVVRDAGPSGMRVEKNTYALAFLGWRLLGEQLEAFAARGVGMKLP